MGSTVVHSEVIRAEVARGLRAGIDAVDSGSTIVGQGLASVRTALASRWRRQLVAINPAALAGSPTIKPWRLAPWLGRQNEQQLGGIDNCPDWVTGELRVGGRGNARGYRGSPNPTADCVVEHDVRVSCRTELAAAAADVNPVVLNVIGRVVWPRVSHMNGGQPHAYRAWFG